MTTSTYRTQRAASAVIGTALVAYSGWLTFEHSHDVTAPIIAVVGAVMFHLGETSLRTRKWVTGLLFGSLGIFAVAISLNAVIDRMASRYDRTVQSRASENTSRRLAETALTEAKQELATASQEAAGECKSGRKARCLGLEERETEARRRVEGARLKLAALGADTVTDPSAKRIAWALGVEETSVAAVVPMLPAIWLELAGILMLTYGLSPPKRIPASAQAAPAVQAVQAAPTPPVSLVAQQPVAAIPSHKQFSRKGGLATAAKRKQAKLQSP